MAEASINYEFCITVRDDDDIYDNVESQGTYFPWKATALGKNSTNGKSFLEKRYSEKLELEDAVHAAILTLKESFEGQMTEDNIEIGVCSDKGFRVLPPHEVKDYLAAIP